MRITIATLCGLLLLLVSQCSARGIIYTLLSQNVAGSPLTHQKQTWPFDPDVGLRRRAEFQQLNGYRGEQLVERVGLGEDGRMDERRLQQHSRDTLPVPPEQDWRP